MVRILRDGPGPGVAVKTYRESVPAAAAEAEYAHLIRLKRCYAQFPALHVPDVLALEPGRLVMREIAGDRLDTTLARFLRSRWGADRRDAHVLGRSLFLAGRWIRVLSDTDPDLALGVETEDWKSPLANRIRSAARRAGHGRVAAEVAAVLTDRLMQEAGPGGLHHPDYSPYNMIVSRQGLSVLDLQELGMGHPLESVAFFWAYLELLSLFPFVSRRQIDFCQRVFLKGTGYPALPEDWRSYGVLLRYSYLGASDDQSEPPSYRARLWRPLHRRLIERWLTSRITE